MDQKEYEEKVQSKLAVVEESRELDKKAIEVSIIITIHHRRASCILSLLSSLSTMQR
jgi:hypothetical protein